MPTTTAPTHTPANLAPPMTEDQGWSTLEAPELFSFEKPGSEIAGVLIAVSSVELRGKKVVQYTLAGANNRVLKLLGTYDLVQKLTRAHTGCMVRIRYRGTDPEIKKGDNEMKVFHVMIKGTPTQQSAASSPITDEDIPF